MGKYGQYGLKGIMAYPVVTDTADEYTVGEGFLLPTAQEAANEADVSEATIYADDTVYHKVRDEKGVTITLTLAELPGELKAQIAGGEYDETLKKYTFPTGSTRPTVALRSIVQFVDDSGWHVEYAPVCEIMGVEMAGNKTTRGDSVAINPVNLIMYSKPRKCDNLRVIEYEPETEAEMAAAEADFIAGVAAP